jgi:hypothetical protein
MTIRRCAASDEQPPFRGDVVAGIRAVRVVRVDPGERLTAELIRHATACLGPDEPVAIELGDADWDCDVAVHLVELAEQGHRVDIRGSRHEVTLLDFINHREPYRLPPWPA